MRDIATATWTTYIDGEAAQVPATTEGIRATLGEADRTVFDAQIGRTPAQDLHQVLARWALPGEAENEDDAAVARLKAGDFTGCVLQDGQEDHTGAA